MIYIRNMFRRTNHNVAVYIRERVALVDATYARDNRHVHNRLGDN